MVIAIAMLDRTIKDLMLWLRALYSNSKVLSKLSVWIFNFEKTGAPSRVLMINPVRHFALFGSVSDFIL